MKSIRYLSGAFFITPVLFRNFAVLKNNTIQTLN